MTQNEQTFLESLKSKKVLFEPKLGQLPRMHRLYKEESALRKEHLGTGLGMLFIERVTNLHNKGHSRQVQTLSYVFSLCKAVRL